VSTAGFTGEALCNQFLGGTAATISTVVFDTHGTTLSKVITPGQFWYYVAVSATTTGTNTFTITQSTNYAPTTGTPFFTLGSGTMVYDANCNPLSTTVTGTGDPTVTVSFTGVAGTTYVIGVKYTTHSVVGSGPACTTSGCSYGYTFATTGASASLSLTHQ
jgi:hypothetical protein